MLRPLVALACTLVPAVAQAAVDLDAVAARLQGAGGDGSFVGAVPADVRERSRAFAALIPAEDTARLFRDGLRRGEVGISVAVTTLLEAAERASSTPAQLERELQACRLLAEVARGLEVRRNLVGALTPEWLAKVGEPARACARAALAQLLQAHREDDVTARAIARGALELVEEPPLSRSALIAAQRDALSRLGADGGADQHVELVEALLAVGDLDGARAQLERARAGRPPFDLDARERVVTSIEGLARAVERVAALRTEREEDGDSPLLQLKLAQAMGAADVEERCRALIAEGLEHALPDTVLGLRALLAGRREEAKRHAARARSLPGRDQGVALLVAMLAIPELKRRLADEPEDEATALEFERVVDEFDQLLGDADDPGVAMLHVLRDAGWPQVEPQDIGHEVARLFGARRRAPTTAAEFSLALAGVLGRLREDDGGVAAGLEFLQLPVAAALQQRPLLMRERAATATTVAVWASITGAPEEALAAARACAASARDRSRALGDAAFAGYLEAVERWADADDAAAQRAVLESLRALEVSPVQSGAWLPASAPLVLGCLLEGRFDRGRFVELRTLTGRGRDPLSMVPLAAAGLLRDPDEYGKMADFLRGAVRSPRARDVLAVAEIEASESPGVQAARARQVLGRGAWSEHEARELAHGLWFDFELAWTIGYGKAGPGFEAKVRCRPLLLPKLPVAARLRQLARVR